MTWLFGGAAWIAIYIVGRIVAAWFGYGADIDFGGALSVTIPTILGMSVAQLIWARRP